MPDQTTPVAPSHSCETCTRHPRRTPVSRRSMAGLVGMSAVGVPLLAACGDDSSAGGSATGGSATGGSTASSAAPSTSGGSSAAGSGTALATTADIEVGGGKIFPDEGVVVTQPTAGEFKAFSSTCTHQGCQVSKIEDGTIDCTCHGSEFSIVDGSVEAGPAPKALPEVEITVSGDQISLA